MNAEPASGPLSGDAALLAAYAAGDAAAARQLMLRIAPRIHALAVRMLRDRAEAEDVTQEAMLRLWKIAPDWRDMGAAPSTWTYRVAANLCTDRLRRRARQVPLEPEMEPEDGRPGSEARLQAAAREAALQAALAELPERQRLAVILRHLEDRANPEIAEILGISVEAVESLTARGKRALARALAGQREALGLIDGTG
ncbi:sigma-70 family RNA polymerase sigma factor [Mangrovicoccus algicola]|uniref:Sigma-70 family RNA polymerase sigma factor n=1 Tax=Mangrovicoccus algicola TaxID=2771008 RepID=A0A8J6YZS2_9RHOB|nr:sigma-70 family RNA polymerase sigma factor [Mangrovicoccus algicola]MBE3639754.1 sigma-70 family RNA polymerase sigma factor [Mangrovicoccus algicola]